MTIFINPDAHQKTLSTYLDMTPCPGLEELTGCDLCLSEKPIKPTKDLDWHKEHQSIFIQVKIGFDIFSFDALKSTAARLRQAGISKQNSYVLFIGRCYPDHRGNAVIDGQKYGGFSYQLFEELQSLLEVRCCHFRQIPSLGQLKVFVEALLQSREKIKREGARELYEGGKSDLVEEVEPLQDIIIIDKDDPRYVLVNGLDGYGPQLAKETREYILGLGREPTLYNYLDVLSAVNPKGKRLHPVKGWGNGSVEHLRFILGLQSSYDIENWPKESEPYIQNLSTAVYSKNGYDPHSEHYRGMRITLEAFREAGKSGITNGKELLFAVERAASALWCTSPQDYQEWAKSLYADDWLKLKYPNIWQEFINERTKGNA